jgi:hypothetical protein
MSKKIRKTVSSRTSKKTHYKKSKSKITHKTPIKIEKPVITADVLRKNVDDLEKKLQLYVN